MGKYTENKGLLFIYLNLNSDYFSQFHGDKYIVKREMILIYLRPFLLCHDEKFEFYKTGANHIWNCWRIIFIFFNNLQFLSFKRKHYSNL